GKSTSYSYIDNKPVLQSESESTKPLPGAIGHLTNLKYLRLRGFNELPEQIAQLHSLETLVYMKCSFTEFPKVLCQLKNLREVSRSKYLKSLTTLYMSGEAFFCLIFKGCRRYFEISFLIQLSLATQSKSSFSVQCPFGAQTVPHFLNQKLVSTVKVIVLLELTITTVHSN